MSPQYVGSPLSSITYKFSTLLFSYQGVSDSLRAHGLQHARLSCPSPSPGACSNSCPWSQWCHPTVSSSVIPLSSCPRSFPASGSFTVSQLFASGSQGMGASASVLPVNIQGWFPVGSTGLISSNLVCCLGIHALFNFYFIGRIGDLQCCVSFRYMTKRTCYTYILLLFGLPWWLKG